MKAICTLFIFISGMGMINAQKFTNAGEYMGFIQKQYQEISKDTWSYISAVAHGKSARKVEKRRMEVITTTQKALSTIKGLQPFDGDKTLRDSAVSYLTLSLNVVREDYGKIMDLEAIAEQSFDAMEAYLLAQEKAGEKMDQAGEMMGVVTKAFAEKHGVTLIESKDQLGKKMEIASEVIKYYNQIYLIFFKSYKQEAYMLDAVQKADVNGVEQNKTSLNQFAKEGLEKLKDFKPYNNDGSIITACNELLKFYVMETEEKISSITDFLIKKENFDKKNAAFQAKKEKDRTQADIDQINAAGKEYNEAVNNYNKTNTELFNKRKALLDNWNKTVQTFLDKQIPQKK